MNPADRRYTATHEWAKLDGDVVTVGITQFAVEQLTEPTFLELPPIGKVLTVGKPFGVIESVKSNVGTSIRRYRVRWSNETTCSWKTRSPSARPTSPP